MKEQDKVFFGEQGLTSASAGHICTMCAERAQVLEAKLGGINLLDKEIEIVATGTKTTVSNGWSSEDVARIPDMLQEMGDYHALTAWLKEAIKAREAAAKEVAATTYDEWKELTGVEEDEEPRFKTELVRPVQPCDVRGEEILATWSVKDRNRVYELTSRAAIVGKYIGKDGAYTKARKAFLERHNNPVDVSGEGQDTTIYRYTPSVDDFREQSLLAQLETMHRSLNAELNGLLHRVEIEGRNKAAELNSKYEQELSAYNEAYRKERREFDTRHEWWAAEHRDLEVAYSKWKKSKMESVQALKIVVPNELKATYEKVKS